MLCVSKKIKNVIPDVIELKKKIQEILRLKVLPQIKANLQEITELLLSNLKTFDINNFMQTISDFFNEYYPIRSK